MCVHVCRGMHMCVLFVQVHTCTYVYLEVRGQSHVSISRYHPPCVSETRSLTDLEFVN